MSAKHVISLLLAVIMLVGLTACGGSSASSAPASSASASSKTSAGTATKDTLLVALQSEPASIDPYAQSSETGFNAASTIFESLIKNVDGKLVPWLATSWEMVDTTTIRFKLRDNVYFHDGNKMTAEDVRFTLVKGAESSFTKTIFGCIDVKNTKAIDNTTVEVKLLYAYAPLLEALASYRGAILSKASYESKGAEAFGRAPVGTGPMMFKNWVVGDRIELVSFDKYWGKKPAFNKLTFRIILEASSRSIELETGGVDISFQLAPADWTRIQKNEKTQLLSGTSMSMAYLCFNNSIAPFDNVLVRKGLAYGINVAAVAKTAWQGQAEAADSFLAKSIPGYKKEGPWEYNPTKAKELLTQAGYPNGLEVKFITFEQQYYRSACEVIQSMWKEIGVKCTIEVVDLATFTAMNNSGKLPLTVMANGAVIPDPDIALLAWPTFRTISLRHNDKHVDELLEKGKSVYAMKDRIPVYQELQDYLWDKLYLLPLAYPTTAYGASSNITNIVFDAGAVPDLTGIQFKK